MSPSYIDVLKYSVVRAVRRNERWERPRELPPNSRNPASWERHSVPSSSKYCTNTGRSQAEPLPQEFVKIPAPPSRLLEFVASAITGSLKRDGSFTWMYVAVATLPTSWRSELKQAARTTVTVTFCRGSSKSVVTEYSLGSVMVLPLYLSLPPAGSAPLKVMRMSYLSPLKYEGREMFSFMLPV